MQSTSKIFWQSEERQIWYFEKVVEFPNVSLERNQYQAFSSSCQNPLLLFSHLDRYSLHKNRVGYI